MYRLFSRAAAKLLSNKFPSNFDKNKLSHFDEKLNNLYVISRDFNKEDSKMFQGCENPGFSRTVVNLLQSLVFCGILKCM